MLPDDKCVDTTPKDGYTHRCGEYITPDRHVDRRVDMVIQVRTTTSVSVEDPRRNVCGRELTNVDTDVTLLRQEVLPNRYTHTRRSLTHSLTRVLAPTTHTHVCTSHIYTHAHTHVRRTGPRSPLKRVGSEDEVHGEVRTSDQKGGVKGRFNIGDLFPGNNAFVTVSGLR